MCTMVGVVWSMLRANLLALRRGDEKGSVVETVVLTAVLAGLAVWLGSLIYTAVQQKASQINLNNN